MHVLSQSNVGPNSCSQTNNKTEFDESLRDAVAYALYRYACVAWFLAYLSRDSWQAWQRYVFTYGGHYGNHDGAVNNDADIMAMGVYMVLYGHVFFASGLKQLLECATAMMSGEVTSERKY